TVPAIGSLTVSTGANSTTYIAGFNTVQGPQQNTPSVVGAALVAKQDADGVHVNLGLDRNATGNPTPNFVQTGGVNTQFNVGQTYLIVGAYTLDPTATNDSASLWVDPDPTTFGAASAP